METGAKVTSIISYVFPVITLIIWLIIGLVVYFTYGQKHSKVQALPENRG